MILVRGGRPLLTNDLAIIVVLLNLLLNTSERHRRGLRAYAVAPSRDVTALLNADAARCRHRNGCGFLVSEVLLSSIFLALGGYATYLGGLNWASALVDVLAVGVRLICILIDTRNRHG